MTALILEKTWNVYEIYLPPATAGADYKPLMWNIKNVLVVTSGIWTVVSSSDGASNFGAADYWVTSANCIWAISGSNHSWIVLRNTNLSAVGAGSQVCIDLNSATANYGTIVYSASAGFTGGSLTARPTATDEKVLISTTYILYGNFGANIHISSDGECTRVFGCYSGACCSAWLFEKIKHAPSWLTIPVAVSCYSATSGIQTWNTYSATARVYVNVSSYTAGFRLSYLGYMNGGDHQPYLGDIDGNRQNYDGGLIASIPFLLTASYRRLGVYGCFYDFYGFSPNLVLAGSYVASELDSKGYYCYGDFGYGSDGNNHGIAGQS